jgi:DNA-directed RNA polymerase subunit M/transcription elongation factor TFIIS
VREEEVLAWLALGAAARSDGRPLLRPVSHAFVRGIDGAVVTFPPDQERPRLWLSAEDEQEREKQRSLARLPVMTCSTCGQHYFAHHAADFSFTRDTPEGGQAREDGRFWPAVTAASGGRRLVLVDRVISSDDDDDADHAPARTAPVFLCRKCGTMHPDLLDRCVECGEPGPLVRLLAIRQEEDAPGYLTRCVSCGHTGRSFGGTYREPARPIRAVTVSDVHVLAQDMLHNAERRRLLVFTDNRQDAAFQAGWMRDHARRFRLRALMAEFVPSEASESATSRRGSIAGWMKTTTSRGR